MEKRIQHQYFFPHSPEVVWEYLTVSELLSQWVMPNNFSPVVGQDFQFRASPMPALDFDGVIYCRVLELVPCQKLSYSWAWGPGKGNITAQSVVEWILKPTDQGTELFLDHGGFNQMGDYTIVDMMNEGWRKNIQKIETLITKSKNGQTNP